MVVGYRLKKDGKVVHVSRSTTNSASGKAIHLTKAVVGHAGQVFNSLPDHVIADIESGEMDDIWEKIELPDVVADESSEEIVSSSALTEDEKDALMAMDLKAMEPEDLQSIADRLDLDIKGTGTEGRILKRDLVAALETYRRQMSQES